MSKTLLYLEGQISSRVLGRKPTAIERLIHNASLQKKYVEKRLKKLSFSIHLSSDDIEDVSDRYQEVLELSWEKRELQDSINNYEDMINTLLALLFQGLDRKNFAHMRIQTYECVNCIHPKEAYSFNSMEELFDLLWDLRNEVSISLTSQGNIRASFPYGLK